MVPYIPQEATFNGALIFKQGQRLVEIPWRSTRTFLLEPQNHMCQGGKELFVVFQVQG